MLIAALGVIAALAFVLGLGALCLYALKRWGAGSLKARQRVPVEVVQRIALGPKTGLAVVRVGEKVMALSVGDGGVRPLFELEEADRARIVATSPLPLLQTSSAEATAAFAPLAPQAVHGNDPLTALGTKLGQAIGTRFGTALSKAMQQPATPADATGAPTTRVTTQDLSAVLNMSLSTVTKLAVFAGAMLLVGAPSLHAQSADSTRQTTAATAINPNTVNPNTNAAAVAIPDSIIRKIAATAPAQVVIPKTSDAPPIALPKGKTAPTRPVPPQLTLPAAPTAPGATPARAPIVGNGADLTAQAAAARRPQSDMVVTPAEQRNGAQAASPAPIAADDAIMRMMPQMDVKLGGDGKDGGLRLNGTVGIVVMMGLLTLLPTLLLMMTGFTRILIVLHFLKQAMGTQSAPPAQLLAGLALLLTAFVMGPTLKQVNEEAVTPWLDGKVTQVEMLKTGVKPFRTFMLKQTRESDLKTFIEMSRLPRPNTADDVPLHVLMSAFVASELRTAFQIGFAIYLPFIIIDAVVASVLMSMGMMMLPPAMISLPFKLLLFVLVDGWSLTISSLVQSFK